MPMKIAQEGTVTEQLTLLVIDGIKLGPEFGLHIVVEDPDPIEIKSHFGVMLKRVVLAPEIKRQFWITHLNKQGDAYEPLVRLHPECKIIAEWPGWRMEGNGRGECTYGPRSILDD